ncbi:hypothetical protein CR513_44685, partial [Mucuna pruriens]
MVLRENGEVDSESTCEDSSSSSEAESSSEGRPSHVEEAYEQLSWRRSRESKGNYFHSMYLVHGKSCSLIIYGGSCVNVSSLRLVEKLTEKRELVVNRQVSLVITLESYRDNILCDVMPMEATHILLGRPFQYAKKEKVVLKPLSPREFCENQMKMRIKREEERKEQDKTENAREKKKEKKERKSRVIEKRKR